MLTRFNFGERKRGKQKSGRGLGEGQQVPFLNYPWSKGLPERTKKHYDDTVKKTREKKKTGGENRGRTSPLS